MWGAKHSRARSARTSSNCRSALLSGAANSGPPQRTRLRSSEAGGPAAVLADIGGCALVAMVGRRAVVKGERPGRDAGPVIVQIADRVGQRVRVVAVVPVVTPRLCEARGKDCGRQGSN